MYLYTHTHISRGSFCRFKDQCGNLCLLLVGDLAARDTHCVIKEQVSGWRGCGAPKPFSRNNNANVPCDRTQFNIQNCDQLRDTGKPEVLKRNDAVLQYRVFITNSVFETETLDSMMRYARAIHTPANTVSVFKSDDYRSPVVYPPRHSIRSNACCLL